MTRDDVREFKKELVDVAFMHPEDLRLKPNEKQNGWIVFIKNRGMTLSHVDNRLYGNVYVYPTSKKPEVVFDDKDIVVYVHVDDAVLMNKIYDRQEAYLVGRLKEEENAKKNVQQEVAG